MRILLVGGSKSGKSSLAEKLTKKLAGEGPCIYWATMEPTDREDDERIERHVEGRAGLGFITLERGRDVTEASLPEGASVLFDSVTALLANEMFGVCFEPDAYKKAAGDIEKVSRTSTNFVCVADEIFRDGASYGDTTEAYRRGLACILRELAKDFDAVCEVSCGIPNVLKGALPE